MRRKYLEFHGPMFDLKNVFFLGGGGKDETWAAEGSRLDKLDL